MVGPYASRSTTELAAVKGRLLEAIGGACNETADRLAEHLDAIEIQLQLRMTGVLVRRTVFVRDEDGAIDSETSLHCPNCDGRVAPVHTMCRRCGTHVHRAA